MLSPSGVFRCCAWRCDHWRRLNGEHAPLRLIVAVDVGTTKGMDGLLGIADHKQRPVTKIGILPAIGHGARRAQAFTLMFRIEDLAWPKAENSTLTELSCPSPKQAAIFSLALSAFVHMQLKTVVYRNFEVRVQGRRIDD